MILLDTNVISEALKPGSDSHVMQWIDAQVLSTLHLSSITLAEVRFGIASMPKGKRRATLNAQFEERVVPLFAGRVLNFDAGASIEYARLRASARSDGTAISMADACIAAIALSSGCAVATRDTAPFLAAGLKVINPWVAR